MDIYGDIEAMHGDSSAMSEKQDRLQAMVQQLGSMLQHAATGMQGRGQVALQRAGEDLQSYGTQQATMQGDHAEKMNPSAAHLTAGDEDAATYLSAIDSMSV